MISLHKLHSHIHYEQFYEYKKFLKFNINTLITIACPKIKNNQNASPGQLGARPGWSKTHNIGTSTATLHTLYESETLVNNNLRQILMHVVNLQRLNQVSV